MAAVEVTSDFLKKTTTIFVRTKVAGFHNWPDAPDHRGYLRDRHRHQFWIEASCEVSHNEREIEFHDLIDMINKHVPVISPATEFGSSSCEAIAAQLAQTLARHYRRGFTVSVSEDGEAGARVELSLRVWA